MWLGLLWLCGLALSPCAVATPEEGSYRVAAQQRLEGPVRWDYLLFEPISQRLFITHGDRVDVYDAAVAKVVGAVVDTQGVHGVALAPALDRGYSSNGQSNTVTVFALSTLQVVATLPTQQNPDAIVYDPFTQRVFVANGKSGTLTVIDALGATVIGTIAVGGKLEFEVVDGKGRLYVNVEDKNAVVVVDTRTMRVLAQHDVSATCTAPTGLSIDPQAQRLFIGCRNQRLAVLDGSTGRLLADRPVGKGCDATAYDAARDEVYASSGDGTLTVISGDNYAVKQVVPTQPTARTLALDPVGHRIFTVAAEIEVPATQDTRAVLRAGTFGLLTISH